MSSHRYESNFRFSAAKYNTSTSSFDATMPVGTNSVTSAKTTPYAVTGLPTSGFAFYAKYSDFWLVAQNRRNGTNACGLNPATSAMYYASPWSVVPNDIKFFDGPYLRGTISQSGYHEFTVGVLKYMVGLGFWHTLDIVNGCASSISIEYRGMEKYLFTAIGGSLQMASTWQSQTIAAGATFNCAAFEPLEVRFNSANLPDGSTGVILQGSKGKYLFIK